MTGQRSGRAQVHVVDDDAAVRAALYRLLRAHEIDSAVYESGAQFLDQADLAGPGCILLDVKMPGMDGLEVQSRLRMRGIGMPTIFLTGAAEVPIAVAAMRAGAIDFIEKPFESDYLVERLRQALVRSVEALDADQERFTAHAQAARLTPREREVLALVSKGLTSKEVARVVGSSHRTIEVHRRNLMEKVQAVSLADLVRLDLLLRETSPSWGPDT